MVGLTGGIGAGKSAVAQRLAELGAVVIDSDALAREVVEAGTEGLADVVAATRRSTATSRNAISSDTATATIRACLLRLPLWNGYVRTLGQA